MQLGLEQILTLLEDQWLFYEPSFAESCKNIGSRIKKPRIRSQTDVARSSFTPC